MAEKEETKKTPARPAPQDRKPSQKKAADDDRKQREMVAEFMTTGLDFSPFTIDPGDGVEWAFTPDPMPADTQALRDAMHAVRDSQTEGEGIVEAFDKLTEVVRSRLMDEKQKKEFPKPIYGVNAMMFFAIHLATGRDGFPTEEG